MFYIYQFREAGTTRNNPHIEDVTKLVHYNTLKSAGMALISLAIQYARHRNHLYRLYDNKLGVNIAYLDCGRNAINYRTDIINSVGKHTYDRLSITAFQSYISRLPAK